MGLEEAAGLLVAGAVVAIPTDTVYGLACLFDSAVGRRQIYELKNRPANLALPVLVSSLADAATLAVLAPADEALARAFWPGPLTIVLPARTGTGWAESTVGLRIPNSEVLLHLLGRVGPLAVTSANPHGLPPATTADEVESALGSEVPVLDGGRCGGAPSTVIDRSLGSDPLVLRTGSITSAMIYEVLDAHERSQANS